MTDLKAITQELAEKYRAMRDAIPESSSLERSLYNLSGIEETEPHALVLVDLDSIYAKEVGSTCGLVGNKVLSEPSILDFLRNKGVKFVIGIVYYPNDDSTYTRGSIPLSSIVVPIQERDGMIFDRKVSKAQGSFRYDNSGVPGWSAFESE